MMNDRDELARLMRDTIRRAAVADNAPPPENPQTRQRMNGPARTIRVPMVN